MQAFFQPFASSVLWRRVAAALCRLRQQRCFLSCVTPRRVTNHDHRAQRRRRRAYRHTARGHTLIKPKDERGGQQCSFFSSECIKRKITSLPFRLLLITQVRISNRPMRACPPQIAPSLLRGSEGATNKPFIHFQ